MSELTTPEKIKLFEQLKQVKTLTGLKKVVTKLQDEKKIKKDFMVHGSEIWFFINVHDLLIIKTDLLNYGMNGIEYMVRYNLTKDEKRYQDSKSTYSKQRIRGNGFHELWKYLFSL